MGYNKIEIEIRRLLSQIETWRQKGGMPTIEQGIALGRLQQLYMMILDLPSSDFDDSSSAIPDDDDISCLTPDDDGVASDESFAPTPDSDADQHADHDDGDFAELSATPQQSDIEIIEETTTTEDKLESEPTNTTEPETESELQLDSSEPDSDPDPESKLESESVSDEDSDSESAAILESIPESADNVEPPVLIKPRIFGIEVNVYARHEIIDTLFRGDARLFEAECETIDAMPSFEEALMYIGETYRWIPENAATIKFIDLIETRFGQN